MFNGILLYIYAIKFLIILLVDILFFTLFREVALIDKLLKNYLWKEDKLLFMAGTVPEALHMLFNSPLKYKEMGITIPWLERGNLRCMEVACMAENPPCAQCGKCFRWNTQ